MELTGNISNYLAVALESLDHTMGSFQTHAWQRGQIITATHDAHLQDHLLSEVVEVKLPVAHQVAVLEINTLPKFVHFEKHLVPTIPINQLTNRKSSHVMSN